MTKGAIENAKTKMCTFVPLAWNYYSESNESDSSDLLQSE